MTTDGFVLSYLGLRRAVGFIGTLLPVALAVGNIIFFGTGLQGSISAYYYTGMRNVLVGSLCAIGVFLVAYRFDTVDNIVSSVAGVLAIGVALFPTAPSGQSTPAETTVAVVHTLCASGLFLTLAYFSYFRFPRPDPGTQVSDPKKKARNVIYQSCGVVIAICVATALVDIVIGDAVTTPSSRLYWLESIAIVAFGVSWLVKGHFLRGAPEAIAAEAARQADRMGDTDDNSEPAPTGTPDAASHGDQSQPSQH